MNQSEAVRTSSPVSGADVGVSSRPQARDVESDKRPGAVRPRSWWTRFWVGLARFLNRPKLVWHRMPGQWLGYVNLFVQRMALQKANLYDTGVVRPANKAILPPEAVDVKARTADGSYNDVRCPFTGMTGERLGRNVPDAWPDGKLYSPLPQKVAEELLARKVVDGNDIMIPATDLNMLAAAWIQFMIHDWFSHGDTDQAFLHVPAGEGYPAMDVRCSPADATRGPGDQDRPPTYVNQQTHWWDASQLYGSGDKRLRSLRTRSGGKLRLGEDGLLPYEAETWKPDYDPASKNEQTGVNVNWWIGLSMLHTLFAHEHNWICDELAKRYPDKAGEDEWLFAKARLITAALIAKIHVLEWTPSTGRHPALKLGVKLAWYGILGKWFGVDFLLRNKRLPTRRRWLLRLIHRCDILHPFLTGIPGSPTINHGVPFSMTEEFAAAYRMHPLLPDKFEFHAAADDRMLEKCNFDGVLGSQARQLAKKLGMTDLFYSFGRMQPGALCLHNYPNSLRQFKRRPPGAGDDAPEETLDIAVIDIMRDRERGVPRYNDFREKMHLPRVAGFRELSKEHAKKLEEVYGEGNIDDVDLMVGMLAETPPKGFAFSDTAFRVFVLMASRRLEADRFFTTDYNEDTYTEFGIHWVESECLKSVLLRHHRDLKQIIARQDDMFERWPNPAIGEC